MLECVVLDQPTHISNVAKLSDQGQGWPTMEVWVEAAGSAPAEPWLLIGLSGTDLGLTGHLTWSRLINTEWLAAWSRTNLAGTDLDGYTVEPCPAEIGEPMRDQYDQPYGQVDWVAMEPVLRPGDVLGCIREITTWGTFGHHRDLNWVPIRLEQEIDPEVTLWYRLRQVA